MTDFGLVEYVNNLIEEAKTKTIFFIKEETTFGPFFSSREKAIAHVKAEFEEFDPDGEDKEENEKTLQLLREGKSDGYISIIEVELDNDSIDNIFDG